MLRSRGPAPGGAAELRWARGVSSRPFHALNADTAGRVASSLYYKDKGGRRGLGRFFQAPSIPSRLQVSRGLRLFFIKMLLLGTLWEWGAGEAFITGVWLRILPLASRLSHPELPLPALPTSPMVVPPLPSFPARISAQG